MPVRAFKRSTPQSLPGSGVASYLRLVREGEMVSREAAVQLLRCDRAVLPEVLELSLIHI